MNSNKASTQTGICRSRTGSFVLDLLYIHLKTQQYPEAPKTLNIPVYSSKRQLVGRQLVFNRHHPNILFGHEIYLARRHFFKRNKESPELITAQQDTKRPNLLKRVFSRLGFRRSSSLARTKKDANVTSTEVKGLGQETNIAKLISVVVTKL